MRSDCIRLICSAVVGVFCCLCARVGNADSWGPPTADHWSANRQYVLHVAWPDKKQLTLLRVRSKGAREEIWSRPYVDETWPPHTAYVANDGKHVVLRDVYHNLGYGKVLVFLGPTGEILRSYELADLLTQDQILATCHSVSSIWWSEPGWFAFVNGEQQFAFLTYHGTLDCFDVATGKCVVLDDKKHAEIRRCVLHDLLPLLKDNDPSERNWAAQLCGALKATEAVPDLKKLLAAGSKPYDGAQGAAAQALASILGAPVVPLIEDQLPKSTTGGRYDMLQAIAGLDHAISLSAKPPASPYLLAAWHRLSKSPSPDVRDFAVRAILDRDQAQYVYDHQALLKSPDPEVRQRGVLPGRTRRQAGSSFPAVRASRQRLTCSGVGLPRTGQIPAR